MQNYLIIFLIKKSMDIEDKIALVNNMPTSEIVTKEDLKEVFENYNHPKHYIGFEISGRVHIGSGLVTALKLQDFMKAGIKPIVFLADYHSWLNKKLRIRKPGINIRRIKPEICWAIGIFKIKVMPAIA